VNDEARHSGSRSKLPWHRFGRRRIPGRPMVLARRLLPIALVSCCPAFAQIAVTCRDADLIVRNGKVVTMDDRARIAQAMAVRDGKILGVGCLPEKPYGSLILGAAVQCEGRVPRVL
jgi:hypothetical protein